MAAAQQRPIARPLFVIAVLFCAVLFAYVIFTQRHQTTDQVVSPLTHPTDQQILGNTKTALPLRQTPLGQFGSPSDVSNSVPLGATPSFVTPSSIVTVPTPNRGSYSNLPPVINPSHPVFVNTGPGQPVSIPHSVVTNDETTTTTKTMAKPGQPPVTTSTTTSKPVTSSLHAAPAYTVLIKSPGDRTRKAVVVNH